MSDAVADYRKKCFSTSTYATLPLFRNKLNLESAMASNAHSIYQA